eukprot:13600984-Alexandrium_andersonii.AAC.1
MMTIGPARRRPGDRQRGAYGAVRKSAGAAAAASGTFYHAARSAPASARVGAYCDEGGVPRSTSNTLSTLRAGSRGGQPINLRGGVDGAFG